MRSCFAITLLSIVATVAASAVAQQPSLDDLIEIVKGEDPIKSAEAITTIANQKDLSDLAIQTLVKALDDDRQAETIPEGMPILFHVRTVADVASYALTTIGKPALSPICEFLKKKPSKKAGRLALQTLSNLKGDAVEAVPIVQGFLNDPEMLIRYDSIKCLASIQKDAEALSNALEPALSDKSPDVRAAAARAFENLGESGSKHVRGIVKLLDDKEDRWYSYTPDMVGTRPVRYDSVMAIAAMGKEGRVALPKLREMMKRDSEPLVCVAAAYAVAKLDGYAKDAVDYLILSVEDQRNGTLVPELACEVLGKLGPKVNVAIPALEKALKHSESGVRTNAIQAIALIAPDSAEHRLFPALKDADALVRASAIEALGELRKASPQLLNAYVAALDDDKESVFGDYVRHAAVVALGNLEMQAIRALPRLNQLVKEEESSWVKEAAEEAIRKIKQDELKSTNIRN